MKKSDKLSNAFRLDRVAFYGRTLLEYLKIFDIKLNMWKGCKILDCPAGASSFVAECTKQGINAVGCDPLFGGNLEKLITQGKEDVKHVIERVSLVPHLYDWSFYPSLDVLKGYRTMALKRFGIDYPIGITEGRYIKAELPRLPFEGKSFDLVLSGHFLFTYSDKFDYSFHYDSILELFRVCRREVRIYPIQGPDAKLYCYIDRLLSELRGKGITIDIMPVPFEFQKGSNQMMCLYR